MRQAWLWAAARRREPSSRYLASLRPVSYCPCCASSEILEVKGARRRHRVLRG